MEHELCALLDAIAAHPVLSDTIALRGGSALHRLYLPSPLRFSEDLDFMLLHGASMTAVVNALVEVLSRWNPDVAVREAEGRWQFSIATQEAPFRVEVNGFELHAALPIERRARPGADGQLVTTFAAEELVATKLRALHRRTHWQDVFDLETWLAHTKLEPSLVSRSFDHYMRIAGLHHSAATLTAALTRQSTLAQNRSDAIERLQNSLTHILYLQGGP